MLFRSTGMVNPPEALGITTDEATIQSVAIIGIIFGFSEAMIPDLLRKAQPTK